MSQNGPKALFLKMRAQIGLLGLENLNPIIFVQSTPVSIDLSQKINFGTKIAQDYISTYTNAPNQEINIDNTAALVELWCHQLTSETTVKSVQATILHHSITLPPNKNGSKRRFSRPWTLLVSYSNCHSIEASHDKCTKFQA